VFVKDIIEGSTSYIAGLKTGDIITSVNGIKVEKSNYKTMIKDLVLLNLYTYFIK